MRAGKGRFRAGGSCPRRPCEANTSQLLGFAPHPLRLFRVPRKYPDDCRDSLPSGPEPSVTAVSSSFLRLCGSTSDSCKPSDEPALGITLMSVPPAPLLSGAPLRVHHPVPSRFPTHPCRRLVHLPQVVAFHPYGLPAPPRASQAPSRAPG